jgi:ATP-dependent helicase/DNAse subunit B
MSNNNIRLSVSKVKTFSDCHKKYDFSYNLKLPQKEFEYHSFGRFIHQVLEDFHLDYINGSTEPYNKTMGRVYKTAMVNYKAKLSTDSQKEAYEMINLYLQKVYNDNLSKSTILAVEKNFNLPITENVNLNGMIDRVQLDPDGIINVSDYKTTKNKKYLKDDFLQLLTYSYVLYCEDPTITQVRGSYILLRHNFESIEKVFQLDEILAVKERYEQYARNIQEEQLWEPNVSRLCEYCSFVDVCEAGSAFMNKIKPKQIIKHGQTDWS